MSCKENWNLWARARYGSFPLFYDGWLRSKGTLLTRQADRWTLLVGALNPPALIVRSKSPEKHHNIGKNLSFFPHVYKYIMFLKRERPETDDFVIKENTWLWRNKNFRKFESFQLRYFGVLELGILKKDIFFISKYFGWCSWGSSSAPGELRKHHLGTL